MTSERVVCFMATYCSRRASKVSGRRTCELWIERQASSGMVDRGCVVGLGAGAAVGGDVASLSHRRLRCRFLTARPRRWWERYRCLLDAMTTAAFRTVVNAARHKDGKKNYIPVISSLSGDGHLHARSLRDIAAKALCLDQTA